jgi:hypothetical protein
MSPAVKYTLGRLGLFVVVFVLLTPVPVAFLVKAMIAVIASAVLSYFLLTKWRNEMAEQLGSVAERRKAEKARLRAALAGDEAAAAAGDRAAGPTPQPNPTPSPTAVTDAPAADSNPASANADRTTITDAPAAASDRAPASADKGDSKTS